MLYQSRIDNSVCGKLYKASLWKDIRFPTDTRYEDLAVAPLLFINADKIKVMRKTTYIYRQQPESYVHTFTLQRSDVLTVTSRLTDFFTHNYPSLARAARARQLNANFNILGLIAANSDRLNDENSATQQSEKDKAMLLSASCWNKIKELRGEALRNPSVRMKTKIGILISYIGGKSLYEKISRRVY